MDTTLITFHLQTSSYAQSVHLIGSWDNFTKHYPMERDVRRASGQWRGCYAFENIICDGDEGSSSLERTGGLKMGSTYYYYYELDDGTEIHDTTLPFTTCCPYLPGQPVNLLWVPVEVQPLRYRSASMSEMEYGDLKTMNPADKFMTPRRPPPTPSLPRSNTAPSVLEKNRPARSMSPKSEKSQWSSRIFGRARSPSNRPVKDAQKRGRSTSLSKRGEGGAIISYPSLLNVPDESWNLTSVPHTRDASPQSFNKVHSREPSPLRQLAGQETSSYNISTFEIPDEISEEAEDDDNFAIHFHHVSLHEKGLQTSLSPPPSRLRSPIAHVRLSTETSKPLPELPEETLLPLVPHTLRFLDDAPAISLHPRSHFSTSTISTIIASPTDSHFEFSETASMSDSLDEDDLAGDISSSDEFTYSPVLPRTEGRRFNGYSLPDEEYGSEPTLRKETPVSTLTRTARTTFGTGATFSPSTRSSITATNAFEELLNEMGYLGDMIVGK